MKAIKNIVIMICGCIGILCFLWMVGTAGSLEHNNITSTQFWIQEIIGFAVLFVDYIGYKVAEHFLGSFDECFDDEVDDYYIDEN